VLQLRLITDKAKPYLTGLLPRHFFVFAAFIFVASLCCIRTAKAETQLTLSPSLLHFDYTEFSQSDSKLNRELGWLPGLSANITHNLDQHWKIQLDTALYMGEVDYTGQTQSGIPHNTKTSTRLFRLAGTVNRNLHQNLDVFVGIRHHQWNRDIQDRNNVSGLDETYIWQEYSLGLDSLIFNTESDLLNVRLAWLLIRNATIDVDISKIGLGQTTLDIGDGSGARLELEWQKKFDHELDYSLSLFFEGWNFGRSNTKATQGGSTSVLVTEPRSETRNLGVMLNFRFSL